jgi:hypothetical protein
MSSKHWAGEEELQKLLQELCGHTGGVPTSKVKQIVGVCNKYVQDFKMVVYEIEKFIKKSNPLDKLGGLFVLDSLSRQHSKERETFAKRFAVRLKETFTYLQKLPNHEKATVSRLLDEWRKKGVFPSELLTPIISEFSATILTSPTKTASSWQTEEMATSSDKPRSSMATSLKNNSIHQEEKLSGKKRPATETSKTGSSTTTETMKKAVKLCAFREGNCPYGDKCRFNHHDTNTIEQYAARYLPIKQLLAGQSTAAAFPSSSSGHQTTAMNSSSSSSHQFTVNETTGEYLLHLLSIAKVDNNKPRSQLLLPASAITDTKVLEKWSSFNLVPAVQSKEDSIKFDDKQIVDFHRDIWQISTEALPYPDPVIGATLPPVAFEMPEQNFYDLFLQTNEHDVNGQRNKTNLML